MENINDQDAPVGANTSEPVHTGAHGFDPWLTVQDAVAYCMIKGLARTPKTVRKWAARSIESANGNGDIVVQRQDVGNGFRWMISRESLDVKIEQEKEFDLRKLAERDGANTSEPVRTGVHLFEQVPTGANRFEPVLVSNQATEGARTSVNTSEPVGTANQKSEGDEMVGFLKKQLDRANQQIDVKDRQIEALLERDRETNILIQGLQTSLTGVVNALPGAQREPTSPPQQYPPHNA